MRMRVLKRALLPGAMTIMFAPAAVLAQAPPEPRNSRTLGELAALCAPPASQDGRSEAVAFCHGYLLGIGDFHASAFPTGSRRGPLFCPPPTPPTLIQVTDSLVTWARANPQYAGDRAVDGVTRWAQATYPCPPQPAAAPATRRSR